MINRGHFHNLCFKAFRFNLKKKNKQPKKETAGLHVKRSVSHVQLSDMAVISPPACLTVLDWKIISDGCLNQ